MTEKTKSSGVSSRHLAKLVGLLRAVVGAVDLDRAQAPARVLELARLRQPCGIEIVAPGLEGPAAHADANVAAFGIRDANAAAFGIRDANASAVRLLDANAVLAAACHAYCLPFPASVHHGAMPTPTARSARSWKRLYFATAALILLAVALDQYLGVIVNSKFSESIQIDRDWARRYNRLAELRRLASAANAPGNDVFESQDVPAERARLKQASSAYRQSMAQVRSDLTAHPVEFEREVLLRDLDSADASMAKMLRQAEQVLADMAAGNSSAAMSLMAEMDRTHALVGDALLAAGQAARSIQRTHFDALEASVRRYRALEFASMLALLLITLGAIGYGFRIRSAMERAAEGKTRDAAELQRAKEAAEAASRAKSAVPGQHEPRDPHADERRARHDRAAARHRARRRAAARLRRHACSAPAEALLAIINDILDFSKIEAGKLELERADSRPREAADDVAELLAAAARTQGPRAGRATSTPDVPTALRGDRGAAAPGPDQPGRQRDQVHRARRGRGRASAGAAEPRERRRAVDFAVADTGIGIPADDQQAHLRGLHAGRRLDDAQATAAPASASRSARQLVELMGGEIGVESEPRRRQHVSLHAAAAAGAEPRRRAAPPDARRCAGAARAGRRRQRDQPRDPASTARAAGACASTAAASGAAALALLRAPRRRRPSISPCSTCTCPAWTGSSWPSAMRARAASSAPIALMHARRRAGDSRARAARLGIAALADQAGAASSSCCDALRRRRSARRPASQRRGTAAPRRARGSRCACWSPRTTRSTRRSRCRCCDRLGYAVDVAGNGREAAGGARRSERVTTSC